MIKKYILEIINKIKPEGWGSCKLLKNNNEIYILTSFLPDKSKITERIYCILNDIYERPRCLECDNFVKFKSYFEGYNNYCSSKCIQNSSLIKNKKIQTSIKKYGTSSWNQSEEVKENQRKGMLKNHGVLYSKQNSEISKKQVESIKNNEGYSNIVLKSKQTKLEKYNDEKYTNQEKRKQTCLERYGVEYPMSEDIQEKRKQTCLERYGVEYVLQLKNIQEKRKKTCLERYGTEYPCSNEISNKRKQTCLERYGSVIPITNNHYSNISQELFWKIYNLLENKEHIYFGDLNKEFNIRFENNIFMYDFVDSKTKKCIEYNGDIWHANPLLYESDDTPNPYNKKLTAKEIWNKDEIKLKALKDIGYDILIIWDSDYSKNQEETLNNCLKFLLDITI